MFPCSDLKSFQSIVETAGMRARESACARPTSISERSWLFMQAFAEIFRRLCPHLRVLDRTCGDNRSDFDRSELLFDMSIFRDGELPRPAWARPLRFARQLICAAEI